MVAGETAMTLALADSLFLSISPDAARTKVILFLAVSMAPFAIVAPFVGPLVDRMRGGQRMVVLLVAILRALVLIGMARELDSLTLFPLAFASLVLAKTYSIAKSSLVPTTVASSDGLVEANSKLGQVAGITGFVVVVPIALLQLISSQAALGFGVLAFIAAALNAYRLPKVVVASTPPDDLETEELHSTTVVAAANAMRVLRGVVGFMFFHLAFWLRREIAGTAWFGLAIGLSGMATLGANFVGPFMRKKMRVETMLLVSLVSVGLVGDGAAWYGRITGGILLAAVVNAAAAIGRLAGGTQGRPHRVANCYSS
jgi:MFS family permease